MSHYENALAAFRRDDMDASLIAINEAMTSPERHNGAVFALLGEGLLKMDMANDAAEAFEEASKKGGPLALDHHRRAILLYQQTGNTERAFLLGLHYLKRQPDDADIVFMVVTELMARGETQLLALFQNRLTASDNPDHLKLASRLIGDDNNNPFNLLLFKKLVALNPGDPFSRFKYYSIAREFCDYEVLEEANRYIRSELTRGNAAIFAGETPYANLLHCPDEALNRLATNNRDLMVAPPANLAEHRRSYPHLWADKIRVGYLSSDFWDDHATMRLFQSVLEAHDRSRFEITLYCYTAEKFIAFDSGNRAGWQPIINIREMSDEEAAATIRAQGCDILVDLKGHTGGSRSKILNQPCAPIHVSWLGFPGSVVNIDLDYVIGDRFVLPDSAKPHYSEKFCRLPECYQPNDTRYRPLPEPKSRAELGLPEDPFIFASFNASRKITLETIDLWAEILRQSEGAILWVMLESEKAQPNFMARMQRHGIEKGRIIFAAKTDYQSHLARVQAADLGLDTLPYNGHTTTSDMLWAGLPVLTKRGTNFASRVSESLLHAVGLPELVSETTEGFFGQAVEYASQPQRIAALKQKLKTLRGSAPLFDSKRFAANLERAFAHMADRAKSGLAPDHLDV